MKNLIVVTAILLSASAQAITCNVKTQKDAEGCMAKLAASLPEYEEPNEAFTTTRKDLLKAVINGTSGDAAALQKAAKADFVGAILTHGDEHEIEYYAIRKGRAVKPENVATLYVVDMPGMLRDGNGEPLAETSVLAKPLTWFLGDKTGTNTDIFEDIEASIAEAVATH